ncbi:MAG TPA: ankyrin repeat domain-containing protein [Patescibacteria group bacterium]|jgi:ankyrin repeat protein|nr:ankyrin repeat domain-containing protein [Patescibacteria group bacterium]
MNEGLKKMGHKKILLLFLLLRYHVQLVCAFDSSLAKKYAVISFLKSKILGILLLEAAKNDDDVAIIESIKRGAELNIKNWQGQTPLIVAVTYGNQAAAEALIFAGASVSIKDQAGKTALDYARNGNGQKMIELLLQKEKNK